MSDSKDTGTQISRRQRNYTLGVLVLVFTSSHVDRQIVAILGQPIKEALLKLIGQRLAAANYPFKRLTGFNARIFQKNLQHRGHKMNGADLMFTNHIDQIRAVFVTFGPRNHQECRKALGRRSLRRVHLAAQHDDG